MTTSYPHSSNMNTARLDRDLRAMQIKARRVLMAWMVYMDDDGALDQLVDELRGLNILLPAELQVMADE